MQHGTLDGFDGTLLTSNLTDRLARGLLPRKGKEMIFLGSLPPDVRSSDTQQDNPEIRENVCCKSIKELASICKLRDGKEEQSNAAGVH